MRQFCKLNLLMLIGLLQACASTSFTTHYGIFDAENSAGDIRQFKLYWQVIEIEGWSGSKRYRTTPVTLETQCSDRYLRFYDRKGGSMRSCIAGNKEGVAYCGQEQIDVDPRGLPIEDDSVCATLTDRYGSREIMDLEGELLLSLSCQPKETKRKLGKKLKNQDYLKPSATPYVVATRSVPGKDVNLVSPLLSSHSTICDPGKNR